MESRLRMRAGPQKNEAGLLPHRFKKVGIAVMVMAFVPAVITKATGIDLAQAQRALLRTMTLNVFILGLLFIAWAKDKVEDEMTIALRLKSISFAFFTTVVTVILEPLIKLLFNDTTKDTGVQGLVISMLLIYLMLYYVQKKGR